LTVLSSPFNSGSPPGRTDGPIFTLYGSNDVFPRSDVPFVLGRWTVSFGGKYSPKPPNSGRD